MYRNQYKEYKIRIIILRVSLSKTDRKSNKQRFQIPIVTTCYGEYNVLSSMQSRVYNAQNGETKFDQ